MEIVNPSNFSVELGLETLEQKAKKGASTVSLKIGLPRERSNDERRISLTPGGTSVLVANGHEVYVEKDAGREARFSDSDYADAGARIVYNRKDLYGSSDLIVKVAPPDGEEIRLFHKDQILISAVHLGSREKSYFEELRSRNIACVGFEYMQETDKSFPIVRMLHEITGSMSIQIASHYLESTSRGQGSMLGGISGVPPSTVVILGAGIIAEYAARTALGYGAQVFVLDNNLSQLRRLENALDRRIITAMANHQYLTSALQHADVVIGSALVEGSLAPCWVTEAMVRTMKEGSVIVDTVIDQGGCIATSHPTTHSDPVYIKHGVIHYCVPNIPSSVARTATHALNNVIGAFLMDIGDAGGIHEALWKIPSLRSGTYIYKGLVTKKLIADRYDLPYRDIDMLIASHL